jgi:multimeric flavodoxin WrbA
MRISVVIGSPRRASNSAKLADAVVAALADRQPEVSRFVLNDLKIRGCQACMSCKTRTEACVLKDDLAQVLSVSAAADLLVVASPIYIGEITSQAKIFIDRTFSWFKPDFKTNPEPGRIAPGKTAILLFTQGNPDPEAYARNLDYYQGLFANYGFSVRRYLATTLSAPDAEIPAGELAERARELVQGL